MSLENIKKFFNFEEDSITIRSSDFQNLASEIDKRYKDEILDFILYPIKYENEFRLIRSDDSLETKKDILNFLKSDPNNIESFIRYYESETTETDIFKNYIFNRETLEVKCVDANLSLYIRAGNFKEWTEISPLAKFFIEKGFAKEFDENSYKIGDYKMNYSHNNIEISEEIGKNIPKNLEIFNLDPEDLNRACLSIAHGKTYEELLKPDSIIKYLEECSHLKPYNISFSQGDKKEKDININEVLDIRVVANIGNVEVNPERDEDLELNMKITTSNKKEFKKIIKQINKILSQERIEITLNKDFKKEIEKIARGYKKALPSSEITLISIFHSSSNPTFEYKI